MPPINNSNNSKKFNPFYIPKETINHYFEKKFKYNRSANWKLPSPATTTENSSNLFAEHYDINFLQEYKIKLNDVKSRLNDYPIEEWSLHTGRRNPAGNITGYLKNKIKAEFVTQAWCKFYECLHQYPIVSGPNLRSVHLCEAPGAFIAALNHYLYSTYCTVDWEWLASTLNPYYEGNALSNMAADDRFMLHTLDRWMFGTDFTGNIISKKNIEHMAECCKKNMGTVSFVTADGSIDCMENPDNQEEIVSTLHYAEICAALTMLSEGGAFILKTFTLFESTSVSLMYLLNCVFKEVHVYKPITSKCGNSETYVICIDFCKNTIPNFREIHEVMLSKLETPNLLPIFSRSSLPDDFIEQHRACTRLFMDYQIDVIESNIENYQTKSSEDLKYCQLLRNMICDHYLKRYKIRQLPIEYTILYDRHATVHYESHKKIYTGSYTARSLEKHLCNEEKFKILQKQLSELEEQIFLQSFSGQKIGKLGKDHIELQIIRSIGKPITKVCSSLFAHLHLMHLRKKIASLTTEIDTLEKDKSQCELFSNPNQQNQPAQIFATVTDNAASTSENERKFFWKIVCACIGLEATKITFKNVLFLTHYSVSIIRFMWSNIFTNLFIEDGKIILQGRKVNAMEKLQELVNEFKIDNLLCIVNIKELHKNCFCDAIINYNNELLLSLCKEKLENISISSLSNDNN